MTHMPRQFSQSSCMKTNIRDPKWEELWMLIQGVHGDPRRSSAEWRGAVESPIPKVVTSKPM